MAREYIGRYQIQSEIGRGGMATVYLAYDPNFRRNVAIKLVASGLQTERMYRQRFEREAHLIARIEHPAIVPVYDYGEVEGNLFLVMRYMPGGSLADRLKAGVLTLRGAADILSQLAPALDAVHSQGIVHRDLKPANILFDAFGNPAMSDFGIAHFTAATADLTGSAIIGTPAYMSPEQVRGEGELDGRSDIYALGIILFEMLAGRGPFQATTPVSIAFKHVTDPIPSISLFRPDLPPQVDHVLNKALAKDRTLRYATASELARAVRTVSEGFQEAEGPVLRAVGPSPDAATEVDSEESAATSTPGLQPVHQTDQRPLSPSSPLPQSLKPRDRRLLMIAALAGVGLLLFIVCGSLGVFGAWAGLGRLFAPQNRTVPEIPTATQTNNIQAIVLFADDFTDPNSGWPVGENAQASYGYRPGGYHILVTGDSQVQWVSTDRTYDDVSIQVEATPMQASTNGYYGLLCRFQDNQNFYYFVIQGNGDFTMGKYKDGEFNTFFPEGWRRSNAVRVGSQTNRLRADCSGDTLQLFVNDVLVGEAADPEFTSGLSGFLAATLGEQDFEVRFNQFMVTREGP